MRHAANLATSERLQKVYAVLQDGQWHTTFEIMQKTDLVSVGSSISELRAPINGFEIKCECVSKGKFQYQLIQESCPPRQDFLTPFFTLEAEQMPKNIQSRLQSQPVQEEMF